MMSDDNREENERSVEQNITLEDFDALTCRVTIMPIILCILTLHCITIH